MSAASAAPALPWVERYRPRTLDAMIGNDDVVAQLRACLATGDMSHMLFVGPPGTGKTSAALCVARAHLERALDVAPSLRGAARAAEARRVLDELCRAHILIVNASEERGIQAVRGKVKVFAAYASMRRVREARLYKLVVFDDCDHLTPEAQASLRRLTEEHAPTTRFLFTCNEPQRLIQALQSRCLLFSLRGVRPAPMRAHLARVGERERVRCTPAALDALAHVAGGDVRRGVASLQAVAAWRRHDGDDDDAADDDERGTTTIDADDVRRLCGVEPLDDVYALLAHVLRGEANDALLAAHRMRDADGVPVADLLETLYAVLGGDDAADGDAAQSDAQRALRSAVRTALDADGLLRVALLHELTIAQERARRGLISPVQWSGLVARMCDAASRSRARARDVARARK